MKNNKEKIMKRVIGVIVVLCVAFAFLGCGSQTVAKTTNQSSRVPSGFPDFVKDALKNVPEDVLVGIGVANNASPSQSMTISQTRARADISRQLNTMIQDMVRDYQASSEIDRDAALSFQENITVALSKSTLVGSKIIHQDQTADGSVWTVVWLSKTDVAKEINQAQAAAKLAVPAMASFSAEDRMNEAFSRQASQEYQANGN